LYPYKVNIYTYKLSQSAV